MPQITLIAAKRSQPRVLMRSPPVERACSTVRETLARRLPGLFEADRQHRLAAAAAHRHEARLSATERLNGRWIVLRADRPFAARAARLTALERRAVRAHIAEPRPLLASHQAPPGRFCWFDRVIG